MGEAKFKLGFLKVSVPKVKRKSKSDGITRISNEIQKGRVFIDKNGIYKVAIDMKNDPANPDYRVLEFTDRSYELKDRTTVFGRVLDKGKRIIRYIRNELDAKFFPGLREQYIPFAPNWIVKGYIVNENNVRKFDFKELVTVNGYENIVITE